MNTDDEPSPENRTIVFTVEDGLYDGSASLSLSITTIDDKPTLVSSLSVCVTCTVVIMIG